MQIREDLEIYSRRTLAKLRMKTVPNNIYIDYQNSSKSGKSEKFISEYFKT